MESENGSLRGENDVLFENVCENVPCVVKPSCALEGVPLVSAYGAEGAEIEPIISLPGFYGIMFDTWRDNVWNDSISKKDADPLEWHQRLLIDEPFLRRPLESAYGVMRAGYKTLEIDLLRLNAYVQRNLKGCFEETSPFCETGDGCVTQNDDWLSRKLEAMRGAAQAACRAAEFLKKIIKKVESYRAEIESSLQTALLRIDHSSRQCVWPSCQMLTALSEREGATSGEEGSIPRGLRTLIKLSPKPIVFDLITQELDTYIFDYLSRLGLTRTAQCHKQTAKIDVLVDGDILEQAMVITECLRNGVTEPALAWCAVHKAKLRKMKSALEAQLQIQCVIDLIVMGEGVEAVNYLRNHFSPDDIKNFPEIKRVLSLLALVGGAEKEGLPVFDFDIGQEATMKKHEAAAALAMRLPQEYQDLLTAARWTYLLELFENALYQVSGLPKHSPLVLLMTCGVAALKSAACEDTLSPSCPTCNPFWKKWMQSVLGAHHVVSFIICPVKGHVTSDKDPPLASPDGLVFSSSAVSELKDKSKDGSIECPYTGNCYSYERFNRLYVS